MKLMLIYTFITDKIDTDQFWVAKPIVCHNDEMNDSELINRHPNQLKMLIPATISFLPTGSTVAVRQEEKGLWMHRTIVRQGSDGCKGRSYKMIVMKTGCIAIKIKKHVKATSISVGDYLSKMLKANRTKVDDKLNEHTDCFQLLN